MPRSYLLHFFFSPTVFSGLVHVRTGTEIVSALIHWFSSISTLYIHKFPSDVPTFQVFIYSYLSEWQMVGDMIHTVSQMMFPGTHLCVPQWASAV